MNFECLSRICRWLFARFRFVLIVTVALWSISLMSCKSQQIVSTSESSYHHQANLSRYDSLRVIDLSVIHDTIAVLRTETLWREPDSLGNIYPLMTVNEERAAWRETDYNIQTTRIDTIYLTTNTTTQQSAKTQTKIRAPDSTIGWIMAAAITLTVVLIITIAAAIAIKSLRI